MLCGRCKRVDVDVQHVRACYSGAPVGPEPASPRPAPGDLTDPDGEDEYPLDDEQPPRGPATRLHRDDGWPGLEPAGDSWEWDSMRQGSGMDADGMTPRLRSLEDEYGFEGMLYMWKDSTYDD